MNKRALNKLLKKEAIDLGLCEGWQRMWREYWDREKLLQKYKEGIDFCIIHDFPKNEFIKQNVPLDLLRKYYVLVDDTWSLLNPNSAVLQGNSSSNIRFNGWNAGTIYIRHTSTANITAKNMSFVIVHLFDNAKVTCFSTDKAKIVALRHSENACAENLGGNVAIKDEIGYLECQ